MTENLETKTKEFYKIQPNPNLIPFYGVYKHAKRCGENIKSAEDFGNSLKRGLGLSVSNSLFFGIIFGIYYIFK